MASGLNAAPSRIEGEGSVRLSGTIRAGLALIAASALAPAAVAQEAPDAGPDSGAYQGDYLIVGLGFASVPSYDGSDQQAVIPAAGVTGRIKGINIGARSAGISLDLLPDDLLTGSQDSRIGFALGPVIRYRGNRNGHIKDPVVARLGKLKGTVEAGVAGAVSVKKLLTPQDSLSVGADMRWDISGHGGGRVTSVGISYFTPLSKAMVMGAAISADLIDDRYADYNFAISEAGSAASGLPVYAARGGLKSWGLKAFAAYDLDGNILNGGFAVALGGAWSRLTGSAAQTPITALRGSRDQWTFGGGLSYTF